MHFVIQQVTVNIYGYPGSPKYGFVYQPSPVNIPSKMRMQHDQAITEENSKKRYVQEETVPETRYREIPNPERFVKRINDVNIKAKQLVVGTDSVTDPEVALIQATETLSLDVLPECGILGLLTSGAHPQMDPINNLTASIPWEAIKDQYLICPDYFENPGKHVAIRTMKRDSSANYCSWCNRELKSITIQLGVDYHLSHLVHGQQPALPKGKEFLFVEDPLGDLCNKDNGECQRHLDDLRKCLQERGFSISLLSGSMATADKVIQLLLNGSVAGFYYFGHGLYDKKKDEGCLRLADGLFYASEIREINPTVPFVFLNGCYSAHTRHDWTVEKTPKSVADAFAKKASVVIAPIFPILNIDAARFARKVFEQAFNEVSFGEAVSAARKDSLLRFNEHSKRDICWMAYRLFGKPNSVLHIPRDYVFLQAAPIQSPTCRIFDDQGKLKMEFFGFAADEVFARAGRHRVLQGRSIVTTMDLVAGLLRKGELTRTLIRLCKEDPDKLYRRTLRKKQVDPPDSVPSSRKQSRFSQDVSDMKILEAILKKPDEELRKLVDQWTIHQKDECADGFVDVLTKADHSAQLDLGDNAQLISERHVLESLLDTGNWPKEQIKGLPSAGDIKGILQDILQEGHIDDNGLVRFEKLDRDALRVIESAHSLSQQRGAYPIPNRLFLAAFFASEEGYASKRLEERGLDPNWHFGILWDSVPKRHSMMFGLGLDACSRAILPVIDYCNNIYHSGIIDERLLFKAFCEVTPKALKESLLQGPFPIDLDYLKDLKPLPPIVSPEYFDESAWCMICRANQRATQEGLVVIRTHHFLSAMLIDAGEPLEKYLQSYGLRVSDVSRFLTKEAAENEKVQLSTGDLRSSFNVRSILARAIRVAKHIHGHNTASVEDILYSSLSNWDVLISSMKGIRR